MAVEAGLAIGGFLITIDQAPPDSGTLPLVANRAANVMLMLAAIAVLALLGRSRSDARTFVALAIGCGILDAAANALLLFGLRLGDLAVMSVLTTMYPADTILLAALVLRERIAAARWIGLVPALVAAGMRALA